MGHQDIEEWLVEYVVTDVNIRKSILDQLLSTTERETTPHTRFPGALPVGLRQTSLHYMADPLHFSNYVVTSKLDGIRMVAIVGPAGFFFVDRALTVYSIGSAPPGTTTTSVYDGELMVDHLFMVFDAMVLDDVCVRDRAFADRYRKLSTVLIHLNRQTPFPYTVIRMVPKRMYILADLHLLVSLFRVGGPHSVGLRTTDAMHPECVRPTDMDAGGVQIADGLIFMETSASFSFANTDFGLLKWKQTPTYDVLVDMKDLCHLDGTPRPSNRVHTHYVEYSERMRRPIRRPFVACVIPKDQRVELWRAKMDRNRWSTLCVECYFDGGQWVVLRGRPDKRRSNSGRTIRDTWWLEQEAIGLSDLVQAFEGEVSRDTHSDLHWLERTWSGAASTCELEVRLLHKGKTMIPCEMFHRVVHRLQADPSMVAQEVQMDDYTCGSLRVTNSGGRTHTIEKEVGFRRDTTFPGQSVLGVRYALSYEHPRKSLTPRDVQDQFSTRRRKHRWRFLSRGLVVIDCTRVRQTDWVGSLVSLHYEIEIELLPDRSVWEGRTQEDGPIQTLLRQLTWCMREELEVIS